MDKPKEGKPKDYYRILGVARDASVDAIKKAYRRLVRKYHPDVGAGSSIAGFEEVRAAYEILSDAERRRRYDEALRRTESERWEPLSWSFVRSPAVGDLRRPVERRTLSGEILLTPGEAAAGGVLPIDVPLPAVCSACEGTGGFIFDCASCSGEGCVERRLPVPVRIPAGVRDGTVFQVGVEDAAVLSILLTVHIRPF